MSHDKIGPREQALRAMREAKFARLNSRKAGAVIAELKQRVAVASTKTGKSRKKKK